MNRRKQLNHEEHKEHEDKQMFLWSIQRTLGKVQQPRKSWFNFVLFVNFVVKQGHLE